MREAVLTWCLFMLGGSACQADGLPAQPAPVSVAQAYNLLPLAFEVNQGQSDRRIDFLARGKGYSVALTARTAILAVRAGDGGEPRRPDAAVVRMEVLGARARAKAEPLDPLPGRANYFLGNDPAKWRRDIPTFSRVSYRGVYPGVDLVYYGSQGRLEYDFVVAPGASPGAVRLGFEGVRGLQIDPTGDLLLRTGAGELRFEKPRVYQQIAGQRRGVKGDYVLRAARQVGFRIGAYDRSHPLVIDPVLAYSTLLGGSGGSDMPSAIAVDAAGNA